eukprot:1870226-Pleurochrysis_carterae.AAC.1
MKRATGSPCSQGGQGTRFSSQPSRSGFRARAGTLMGLGAAPTPELRTRALEFAISGKVKLQERSAARAALNLCTRLRSVSCSWRVP